MADQSRLACAVACSW